MSSADRVDLRYVAEVTPGTTPATPALKKFRFTGESLNPNITTQVSNEIRADRNISDLILLGQDAAGNVEIELSDESYNDMLEAALCGTWVVDGVDSNKFTLVNGTQEKAFTIQKNHQDVTQLFNFKGSYVNTLNLSVGPRKITTGSIGFMALSAERTVTQFAGATTPAGPTTTPYNGSSNVNINTIDAGAIAGGLMMYTLNVNNNRRARQVVGKLGPDSIVPGRFEVTGDLEVYFADGALYDKFANQTVLAFQIEMTDGLGGKFRIDLPRAKIATSQIVAQGHSTDVTVKTTYQALYDTPTLGTLLLTRDKPGV